MGARKYRLLAYGIETKGLPAPNSELQSDKYTLQFERHREAARFQEFDGVIVFQGAFESFERVSQSWGNSLKHTWDQDELDKRIKEVRALRENGGIVCLLLTDPFIEFDEKRKFLGTDISKRLLSGVLRNEFGGRITDLESNVNELGNFFKIYGAAWFSMSLRSSDTRTSRTVASCATQAVSLILEDNVLVVPTLIPKATAEAVQEYFSILADGVVRLWEQIRVELPDWAGEYKFPDEPELVERRLALSNQVCEIDARLKHLERLKRVLVLQGETLVEAVMGVFAEALPLKPKREEAFKEDFLLLDASGTTIAMAEVKGVSRGVAREYVNQADSHRERNKMPPEFPSLLIINTNMKRSASLADKDQAVAVDQIEHAARNNILILRTLDLLNLASLHLSGKLSSDEVVRLLTKSRGWLRVGETPEVLPKEKLTEAR